MMRGIVLLGRQFESHILQPLIMGKAVSLHPLAVIFAVAGGSMIFGATGALFAVPVLAVVNSVVRYLASRGWENDPQLRTEEFLFPHQKRRPEAPQRRPGAEWMLGKPVTLEETKDQAANGLKVASIYQFGKDETADWKQGAAGAAVHAPQAIQLHAAAGGPKGRPIYVAIDDNPSREEYDNQIRPYLKAFDEILKSQGYTMGVYANYGTIDWAIQDGLGSYFWQHDWGSNGQIHPRVTLHQVAGETENLDGIEVDVNDVYAEDWGQWTPGQADTPTPSGQTTANSGNVKLPSGASGNAKNNQSSATLPQTLAGKNLDAKTIRQLGNSVNSISSKLPVGQQIVLPSEEQINMILQIAKSSS